MGERVPRVAYVRCGCAVLSSVGGKYYHSQTALSLARRCSRVVVPTPPHVFPRGYFSRHTFNQRQWYPPAVKGQNATLTMATLSLHNGPHGTGSYTANADDDATSVATSATTLQSTRHSRSRIAERDIGRRDLQRTLKHGHAQVGSQVGTLRVVDEATGLVVVTDSTSKVAITAWRGSRG